jgi:hypothetical protein
MVKVKMEDCNYGKSRNCNSQGHIYDTDILARNIWALLLRDFRLIEGSTFARSAARSFQGGIKQFRSYSFPELGIVSPFRYKAYGQLANLFKKYRFIDDAYTDDELTSRSFDLYRETQIRLSQQIPLRQTSFLALQKARKIAKRILGKYDPERTIDASRFGRKSSIGCPLSRAYLDIKLSDAGAFTGSSECSKWFKEVYLEKDPLLAKIVANMIEGGILEHESLKLTLVPKSWKIHRGITPLTLIALFYSYGVGTQVEEALARCGLDIKRLQEKHAKIIKAYSFRKYNDRLGGSHATVDLSSASDSLTSELLNRILPREWYNACKKTFVHQINIGGTMSYTASVLPMGNGLTFPVETLIFYCLIKAIKELTRTKGICSTYGDDLIYPSRMHKHVTHIFANIKLKINLDKTYVKYPFRESCGADFYRGYNVRSFFLPNAYRGPSRTRYLAWLHQVYNGLINRWSHFELPQTLRYLLSEASFVSPCGLLRVPPTYPDTSGFKVESPTDILSDVCVWEPVAIVFHDGSRWFQFKFLKAMKNNRFVVTTAPYMWNAVCKPHVDMNVDSCFWETDYSYYHETPKRSMTWKKVGVRRFRHKGRLVEKDKLKPVLSAHGEPKYKVSKVKTGSISIWS